MARKKLIKPLSGGSVVITNKFTPDRVQKRLINKLCNKIKNSIHADSYNGIYNTQIYSLEYIVTKIIYFLHNCSTWRVLGRGWENIYAHYKKWVKWNIIDSLYTDLCNQYKTKRDGGHLKVVMTDTSFILNKNGYDCINRNPLVKNKNCTKIFNIVDDKGISLCTNFYPGNVHDCKCLIDSLDKFLTDNVGIVTFLADSGFYTNEIIELLKKHNVKPLIAKNVRNSKNKIKTTVNDKKPTYAQKIQRQLEDMTMADQKIFKKRGKIENMYANYKQIKRFNTRYDKYIINLHGLSLIYFCEQILKHL